MSTKDSINQLVKNITGDDVNTQRITEGLKELIIALDGGDKIKPTDDTISEYLNIVAEVLPDKMGITPTGTIEITENGEYDVTEYAGANVEVSGGASISFDYNIEDGVAIEVEYIVDGDVVVTFPETVTEINESLFEENGVITEVIILANVETTMSSAFMMCKNLTRATINSTSIELRAFGYCENLTTVTLGNNVTTIGEQAFMNCRNLTTVTLGNNVTTIGESAFGACGFSSVTIMPNGTATIGQGAFSGCENLTSVTINENVTTIGRNAFAACLALTDIYYTGTQAQWEAISGIGNAGIPANATIHYNYTP